MSFLHRAVQQRCQPVQYVPLGDDQLLLLNSILSRRICLANLRFRGKADMPFCTVLNAEVQLSMEYELAPAMK